MAYPMQPILMTAATTLSRKRHAMTELVWNAGTGAALTLPTSTGSGDVYSVRVGVTITNTGLKIQVGNGTDIMQGNAFGVDGDGEPGNAWLTSATSDTLNMDGSTQGGVLGDRVVLVDYKAGFWGVQAWLTQSGTEATPFSAAVS